MNEDVKKARTLIGKVISDKMEKSAVVLVERLVKHPKYGKYIKRSTKLHVHDKDNASKVGDLVKIIERKPFSKTKSWEIIERL